MATANVADLSETQVMIECMVLASDEIAGVLAMSRDRWTVPDPELARMIDVLRWRFLAFGAAAKEGRVKDLLTLRTIARAYVELASTFHELATDADRDPGYARECVNKATPTTILISDMVECAR